MTGEARRRGAALLAAPLLAVATGSLAIALAPPLGSAPVARGRPPVPALVFVSRAMPPPEAAGQVPGLGPYGRALVTRGRLMIRTAAGTVRPLIHPRFFHDVSDPAVSFDGRVVAFAGVVHADSAWRIWSVRADGRGLRAVTRTGPPAASGPGEARFTRFDDLDPVWLPDGRLCFASTRWPLVAQAGIPATNLFTVRPDGTGLERLTSDRNGAEEPSVDPGSGRILYARWWTNRWLASERERMGVTLIRAQSVPSDTVNVWHALTLLPDGDGARLAGGDPRTRAGVAAYQPVMFPGGTLVGVRPERAGFEGAGVRSVVQAFPGGFAAPVILAGLGTGGASACAPAALPGDVVALALDVRGRGDYGLWAVRADGSGLTRLVDLPGTLELDPAPLSPRPVPPVASPPREIPISEVPYRSIAEGDPAAPTFRFDCMNVFTNGPIDSPFPDAPPLQRDVRIRFYAALARPDDAAGDTVVLLREARVSAVGGVHVEDLPGDTPMFEQLVDSRGRVLRSSMGPAHVPGLNFARGGSGTKCVGCHSGHSAQEVPINYENATWLNASPSARVTATSVWPGTRAGAVVDRRTRGMPDSVGWIARSNAGEKLRLSWTTAIEVRSVVLYALRADPASATDLSIEQCEIRLYLGSREVERFVLKEPLMASGTRANWKKGTVADGLEIIPLRVSGRVNGRAALGLAEVETIARIHQD